jgi:succinate dehydrogenase / fumarate reductase, cytochrome b subunit
MQRSTVQKDRFAGETRGMADAGTKKTTHDRPLSPHIGIYRQEINMVMSIVHRITGASLYFGTLLLAWWLIAISQGAPALDMVNLVMGSIFGKLVLFGFTWALVHHMLGGLRHFIWDTGRGFDLASINRLGWLTIIGSILITLAIWFFALHARGMI